MREFASANARDTDADHDFGDHFGGIVRMPRRGYESTIQGGVFISENRLFFKSMLARECFCRQQNKQKKWIPVVLNREKIVIFYHFFKTLDGTLDLCMQQNDIAVLRRCQRFFVVGIAVLRRCQRFFFGRLQFYDGARPTFFIV